MSIGLEMTRRHFFGRTGVGIAALASLLQQEASASGGLPGLPHFPPKAKRVIYLFQHGAPGFATGELCGRFEQNRVTLGSDVENR